MVGGRAVTEDQGVNSLCEIDTLCVVRSDAREKSASMQVGVAGGDGGGRLRVIGLAGRHAQQVALRFFCAGQTYLHPTLPSMPPQPPSAPAAAALAKPSS